MSVSLMQKVLGDDWQQLPAVIQRHYRISDGQQSRLVGEMAIGYPSYLFPLIWVIHLFGGLLLWRGQAAQAEVDKTADGELLDWQRTMTYPDGKTDCFSSRMSYAADHELIETIGFGFGLRLNVSVENGELLYRSNGHFWQCGSLRMNIPDWLLLGSASISERAVSDDEFYLDFSIRHPWWGESYYYRGNFRYR
ncbi:MULTISPECIES: DUF4166 domain-containing protein [Methylomonas]|uniref:DUF4166 domain-containing protein n=2 Tax=Methylomonas TaxID=416 RepID=A0A126T536_9GAMM|nr:MULTISPECIES: DUF4166 domain-containing protein [Methylomonas]AMK77182.1 hypothetical protein JT25_011910 [Methylomonas denitrificans]OAI00989.1 hypothetical protein A1342_22305 [Methylomonas methanica]TCV78946.1 uncharacterized protein DUF4166 [Methylomonas methanica]